MLEKIIEVDQNIIKINYYIYMEEIQKNIVHEMLEHYWDISRSKRNNRPLKGVIAYLEHCLLFIAFNNSD